MKELLTWSSVVVQGVAALLWFYATIARVSAAQVLKEYQAEHGSQSGPFQIVAEDGSDVLETIELQTKWNKWAAFATGLGVAMMAVATALPTIAD